MARTQDIPWLGSEVGQGAAGVIITQDRGGDLYQLTGGLGQMETAMVVGGPALAAETFTVQRPVSVEFLISTFAEGAELATFTV